MAQSRFVLADSWRDTALRRVFSPMQHFIASESAGGVVLIGAALVALILANSPLADSYQAILDTYISITIGPLELRETVLHWINDGLMALFFFVVGLELKREVLAGELANVRQALLPVLAAVGGAMLPALIYTGINAGGVGAVGWGVPMATDIAFALGVLALLGDRVPWGLKVLLTAIAVIDDLLAVLVIALFYTSDFNVAALALGIGVLLLLGIVNAAGIRSVLVYGALGIVVWLAFLTSGVHATIAGVLVALTVPARTRMDERSFVAHAQHLLARFEQGDSTSTPLLSDERQQSAILALEDACEAVQAPLQKLEHQLHPWVAFVIVPLFALANAGVALSFTKLNEGAFEVMLGVVIGLVVGKPVGILGSVWLATRLGIVELPAEVTWWHMFGIGCLAGLGFTMSLFIATLGFGDSPLLEASKLGILAASVVAGVVGYLVLRRIPMPDNASTEAL